MISPVNDIQSSGTAFQMFLWMHWYSSKHLCPLLCFLKLGSFRRYVLKNYKEGKECRRNHFCKCTNHIPHIMGQRKNVKLLFHNCLQRWNPLCSFYRNYSCQLKAKNWWEDSKHSSKTQSTLLQTRLSFCIYL